MLKSMQIYTKLLWVMIWIRYHQQRMLLNVKIYGDLQQYCESFGYLDPAPSVQNVTHRNNKCWYGMMHYG